MENDNIGNLFDFFTDLKGQLLTIRQQQASSINTLNVLTNDVAHLSSEMKKLKGEGNSTSRGRGGKRGATSRGGRCQGGRGKR